MRRKAKDDDQGSLPKSGRTHASLLQEVIETYPCSNRLSKNADYNQ